MTAGDETTHQPSRMVAGHCPDCGAVVCIFNEYGVWPPVVCKCGWAGGTTEIVNHVRLERGSVLTRFVPAQR